MHGIKTMKHYIFIRIIKKIHRNVNISDTQIAKLRMMKVLLQHNSSLFPKSVKILKLNCNILLHNGILLNKKVTSDALR